MKKMLTLKRVEEICSRFKDKRILVYGDVILDRYIFGDVGRISPEAPVPVVKVTKEESRPGGAGNVAANIDRLGAAGILLGILGDDAFAEEMFRLKPEHNFNFSLKSPLNKTVVKTRVIAQRQQIVRIDREGNIQVTTEMEDAVKERIKEIQKGGIDGIIVSDYAKGSLTKRIMDSLRYEAEAAAVPIVVDPKPPNFNLYQNITGITPNQREAEGIINKKIENEADAGKAVKFISNKFKTRFSIITRGDKGIAAGEKGKRVFHQPAFSREVYDVTGAGDTVVSVLLLSLASGASLKEAVSLANAAASIVVEKIGTSQVSAEEIFYRMKFLLKK